MNSGECLFCVFFIPIHGLSALKKDIMEISKLMCVSTKDLVEKLFLCVAVDVDKNFLPKKIKF